MTLLEFYEKARAIASNHGFNENYLKTEAGIVRYGPTQKTVYQYSCSIQIIKHNWGGYFDSPEKALEKLELICRDDTIANLPGDSVVDSIDSPVVEKESPDEDADPTGQESEVDNG